MPHDILKGTLRRVVHRAGSACAQEPTLCHLSGLIKGAGNAATGTSTCVEARGDILAALTDGITIADISVIHHLSIDTPFQQQQHQQEQQLPDAANMCEQRKQEWTQMAIRLCPSLWSVMGAWASRR
jgi:hypothetical protein